MASNRHSSVVIGIIAVLMVMTLGLGAWIVYRASQTGGVVEGQDTKAIETAEQEVSADEGAKDAEPQVATTQEADSELDLSQSFPSWNAQSASLAELVDYVDRVCDELGSDYVPPEERIATFDMDGTILCETAPIYIDYCLTFHRVLEDPTYRSTKAEREAMQKVRDYAWATGEKLKDVSPTKAELVASAFEGMTQKEFRAYVKDFAESTEVFGFDGMTYAESFYKPMTEVIAYLQAHDFDVWMVSACEREVVRALVERFGIRADHVVATDVVYETTGQGDEAGPDYTMGLDEEVVLSAPKLEECGKANKSIAIAREIGTRPILAFGNSSGDYSMLNYAEGNPDHPGMGVLVVADDTERDYGDAEGAKESMELVEAQGWTAFSMADDWATIYGEGVVRTHLAGEEQLADAA